MLEFYSYYISFLEWPIGYGVGVILNWIDGLARKPLVSFTVEAVLFLLGSRSITTVIVGDFLWIDVLGTSAEIYLFYTIY